MNTHVFIVDEKTFKVHLEYMFAGTGNNRKDRNGNDKKSPFLNNPNDTSCHHATENVLVGMIADVSRIRTGDRIIFYLQSENGKEGKFFGVFKAEGLAFFDENDRNNYKKKELGKGLTYRIRITSDCVYAEGVTEHELLDNLDNVQSPYQLCWSLIYRKLKGNRGCTMITEHEYKMILDKLTKANNNVNLNSQGYSYDSISNRIVSTSSTKKYTGTTGLLNIEPRLLVKASKKHAFEVHLQAYIMQNFDKNILKNLLLTLNNQSTWIGNEVSCGFGMQRIDVMIIESDNKEVHIKIIELKKDTPTDEILTNQLPWYLNWTYQYVVPNLKTGRKNVILHPCIIAKQTNDKTILNSIRNTNLFTSTDPNIIIDSTEFIGFDFSNGSTSFKKII